VRGLGELLRKAGMLEGKRGLGAESRGSSQSGGPVTASVRFTTPDESEDFNDRTALWTGAIAVGGFETPTTSPSIQRSS
jgi:hypothetical protein